MTTHVSRFARITITALLVATPLLWTHLVPSHADKQVLNRSIYIPIQFRLCEHLSSGVLYINDQAVAHLPTERVFQFTYYPELHRMEPGEILVRVEGIDAEGRPTKVHLAITPNEIRTPQRAIDLDLDRVLKKFRYKLDVRHENVLLKIQCMACGANSESSDEPEAGAEGADETPTLSAQKTQGLKDKQD